MGGTSAILQLSFIKKENGFYEKESYENEVLSCVRSGSDTIFAG